ncbi:MAG: hypothetical protein J0G30_11430 [Actinomycetales bacterium]|nr:hypothetical protein [Actinomycetales bacterium]
MANDETSDRDPRELTPDDLEFDEWIRFHPDPLAQREASRGDGPLPEELPDVELPLDPEE